MATNRVDKGLFRNKLATGAPGLSDRTIDRLVRKLTTEELDELSKDLDRTRIQNLRQFCRQLNEASEPARLQVIRAYAESANF